MLALRFAPLRDIQRELNGIRGHFDQVLGDLRSVSRPYAPASFPALNAWEDSENYLVEAELPGIALEDLEIYVADRNTLTIKGERKQASGEGAWHRRERGYGKFARELTLPGFVDAENVCATLKQGVLTIKLRKAAEMLPRKIEVKTA